VVVCLGLVPSIASAANPVVTITVSKWVVGLPSGFTLTYISEYEVQIDWIKGIGAENTMVRAAIGRPPTDITDGIEIYYGDGTTATSWINMETLSEPVFYRAWSETALGVWSPMFVEDQIEGVTMLLFAFIALALGLFIATFALKSGRRILAFASAGAWMLLGVYSYTKFLAVWDIYYSLFWLSMGLVLVCVLIPVILREKREEDLTPEVDEYAEYDEGNDPFLGKRKKRSRGRFRLG
jgi:hypothetical protein